MLVRDDPLPGTSFCLCQGSSLRESIGGREERQQKPAGTTLLILGSSEATDVQYIWPPSLTQRQPCLSGYTSLNSPGHDAPIRLMYSKRFLEVMEPFISNLVLIKGSCDTPPQNSYLLYVCCVGLADSKKEALGTLATEEREGVRKGRRGVGSQVTLSRKSGLGSSSTNTRREEQGAVTPPLLSFKSKGCLGSAWSALSLGLCVCMRLFVCVYLSTNELVCG